MVAFSEEQGLTSESEAARAGASSAFRLCHNIPSATMWWRTAFPRPLYFTS